jgi:NADH:ubiquinone oxidoreductase subunit H
MHVHEAGSYLERLTMADPGHHWIDRVLFRLAMPVGAMAIALGAIVLPIGPSTATLPGPQLAVGLFFYLVVLDVMAVALFMAGWGANQHAGTNGAFVVGAQLVNYLIPLGFAVTGVVMAAES